MKAPTLTVVAGPNGSGKSTVTNTYVVRGHYVNADEIQRHLQCSSLSAAQIAEATREQLLQEKEDFTIETVLSTERNLLLMARAKDLGYHVACVYVLTNDVAINIRRVAARVLAGEHDVPRDKIISRYQKAMMLFPRLFEVCDELYVYDNSPDRKDGEPSRILSFFHGKITLYPNETWSLEALEKLCNGKYQSPDIE